jgi:beta-fructofuranosidase
MLNKARNYEEKYSKKIKDEERPLFHVTANVGWLNDPNGFSLYKGEYHLFYQYHPYDTHWGPMHWGHMKTTDFIRWERLPAVMAPDMEYDNGGCFSGSAVELPDGRQLLMYTGVRVTKKDDSEEVRQTQCLALGDGTDFKKYENNPVLDAEDIPEGASPVDFRDPKIWRDEEEGCYYAVAGNRPADGSGSILLFRSEDAFNWNFVTVLDKCEDRYGKMWECPDFFELDGTYVILTSPQEMLASGLEFHNGNGTIYLTGSYDKSKHRFDREAVRAIDYGHDFYAPQTLLTPDGRRIMIAWMQSWESSNIQPLGVKWFGMMTIPRELHIVDGTLRQLPVKELEAYRGEKTVYRDLAISERTGLPGVRGRVLDMTVNIRPLGGEIYKSITIRVAENTDFDTSISYDAKRGIIRVDRSRAGFRFDIVEIREVPVRYLGGELKLRIVMDRFSIEIFVNNGEQAISTTIYTPQEADGISFEADGTAVIDVEKYELKQF